MYAESEKDKNEWIGAIGRYAPFLFLISRALVGRVQGLSESE